MPPLPITRQHSGLYLNFRGRPAELPAGWQAWNAWSGEHLVASLAVRLASPDRVDWDEAEYEGPFFHPERGEEIALLQNVFIHPGLRRGALWPCYAELLDRLELPVYAAFANERLGERFRRLYRPRADL